MNVITGPVNWGIIGCGDVCEIKSGPAFHNVDHSRLVAVMRRDLAKAADFAQRHHVPRFYNEAAALINDAEVNAIYIATPPLSHEAYAIEAMKAGKHVYIEKPVTTDAGACERLTKFAHSCKLRVSVAHYRRGLPLFNKVRTLIRERAIGNVRVIRLTTLQPEKSNIIIQTEENWRVQPDISGGGLFHDLSPHQLDIVYWIFGAPREVNCKSVNQSRRYDAPDMTLLNATYDNNIVLTGVWAFNVTPSAAQDSCEIIGDTGMLRFAFFRPSTLEIIRETGTEVLTMNYPVNIQEPMIAAVTNFFRGEGINPCSLEEALVVMRMIDKAKES